MVAPNCAKNDVSRGKYIEGPRVEFTASQITPTTTTSLTYVSTFGC